MFLEFKLAVTHSLHFFVYKQNCALLYSCTYMCVCVNERVVFMRTHTGHQSAVNFRLSMGAATKSIIEVMNAPLRMGISV